MKKKIIVTGGNGFIGTNLILDLLEDKNNKILNMDKLNFSLILVMSLAINLYYIAHLREGLYFAGELSKASLFKFILIKYF
jgi:dTDP-D-glucose 4,6-dehydratase